MAENYFITFADTNETGFVLPSDTIDERFGLQFVGRSKLNYGEASNQNILSLLENFASPEGSPGEPDPSVFGPEGPTAGQLWYNTTDQLVYVFDGTSWSVLATDTVVTGFDDSNVDSSQELLLIKSSGAPVVISNVMPLSALQSHASNPTAHPASAIVYNTSTLTGFSDFQSVIEGWIEAFEDHANALVFFGSPFIHEALDDITFDTDAYSNNAVVGPGLVPLQDAIDDIQQVLNNAQLDYGDAETASDNHIGPTVFIAHSADEITVSPPVGITSTDVEGVLDELIALLAPTVSGAIDYLRVYPATDFQNTVSAETKVLMSIIEPSGSTSGGSSQWNTSLSRYTAAYDQVVNVKFSAVMRVQNNTRPIIEIRYGTGVPIIVANRYRFTNYDNNAGSSGGAVDRMGEVSAKLWLTAGQNVEFFITYQPGFPFNAGNNLRNRQQGTQAEFEVIQVL